MSREESSTGDTSYDRTPPAFSNAPSMAAYAACPVRRILLGRPRTLRVSGVSARFWVPDLASQVEVIVDTWGVPHIYAESPEDLFLAQGFNVARERLFQLDLWRRRGLGLLAEAFGSSFVEQDRARRLFLYRGGMEQEWSAYGLEAKQIVTSFVTGVNAYVEMCEQGMTPWPEEFDLLGFRPSRWLPEDVLRIRVHGLHHNVEQEVARWRTLLQFGGDVESLRQVREPQSEPYLTPGYPDGPVPDDLLDEYRLATTSSGPPAIAEGSNNWAVSGKRTSTGRPLLANDPHRALTLPSLRYLVHLSAPGINMIGAGEPMVPGISIGHNGTAAFGLTVFPADVEDLYVYEVDPCDSSRYRYDGGFEQLRQVTEEIPLAGGNTVIVTMSFTRHGPVIYTDAAQHRIYALRATWLEAGMAPYLGSLAYMGCSTWPEFTGALHRFGGPPMNYVYADTTGDIGWSPAGRVPTRPGWDGSTPISGDGHCEWGPLYALSELTSEANPQRGWVASANEFNLGRLVAADAAKVSRDWYPRGRYERIAEVLDATPSLSVADCARLQTDYLSRAAHEVLSNTVHLIPASPDEPAGITLLRQWDAVLGVDDPGPLFYEVWYRRHFRPALLRAALTRVVDGYLVHPALVAVLPVEVVSTDSRVDLKILADPTAHLGPDAPHLVERLVLESAQAAMKEVSDLAGHCPGTWRWGDLHRALFIHSVQGLATQDAPSWAQVGPIPRGGSGDTVGQTAYDSSFTQTSGATFRLVIDVGEWDRSLAMNAPGQSGRPASAHYDDLANPWGADQSFPLLYSRDAVQAHRSESYMLEPARVSTA